MNKLKGKILSANIEEHKKEAKYYDVIHTELFNYYEQKRINKSLDFILNNFDNDCNILDVGCGTGNLTIKLFHHLLMLFLIHQLHLLLLVWIFQRR